MRINDIHIIRLITKDEIMGEIVETNIDDITVKNPMIVSEAQNKEGTFMVLQSYVPYQDESIVKFKNQHIIDCHAVHPVIAHYYDLSLLMSYEHESSRLLEIDSVNKKMMEYITSKESNTYIHSGTTTYH